MRKVIVFILLIAAIAVQAQKPVGVTMDDAKQTMKQLKKTSLFRVTGKRADALQKFQVYSDSLSHTVFEEYLVSPEEVSVRMEDSIPILYCYRNAFDTILDEVKSTKPERGSVVIWMLYNMGIIVKTPSGCFGIDVNHRWAEKFATYLDFICVTHNHDDHKSVELMQAMYDAQKPVLSNYFEKSGSYCSKNPNTYQIGNFSIRTGIADHNKKLLNFITTFRIDCGDDTGNFSILHCGDSNFLPEQFENVQGAVGLVILRNGSKVENNILGTGTGQVQTDYAVLSHIIELRHRIDSSPKRFPVMATLNHASQINCKHTIMPFWGEKLIWKNGKLQ